MKNGLRNWALLNKDVANLQKHLKGKLPSQENVLKLLDELVINPTNANSTKHQRSSCTATRSRASSLRSQETHHRMTSQKRLLSEGFAITFPKKIKSPSYSNVRVNNVNCNSNDLEDFKLALKLQQEEIESSQKVATQPISECIVNPIAEETSLPDPFESASGPDWQEHDEELVENIEFEADAAAALLQLQRSRPSHS